MDEITVSHVVVDVNAKPPSGGSGRRSIVVVQFGPCAKRVQGNRRKPRMIGTMRVRGVFLFIDPPLSWPLRSRPGTVTHAVTEVNKSRLRCLSAKTSLRFKDYSVGRHGGL